MLTVPPAPTGEIDLRAETGVIVGCVLDLPVGAYAVEVFRSDDHDEMGVRLRLAPSSRRR